MAKLKDEVGSVFVLPKKKVFIKPIIRNSNWLSLMGGTAHSAAWKQDNAKFVLQIPVDKNTGALIEPLTQKEREFFESDRCNLGFNQGDLLANKYVTDQRHNKILKSYWTTKTFTIRKPTAIIDEDTILATLDLSNPSDYLNYAILRANLGIFVAGSTEQRYANARYIIVMVDEGEDDEVKATKADRIAEAYAHYSLIAAKPDKLRELLTVAWLEKLYKIKPDQSNKLEWLKAETNKFIQLDSGESYLKVINNYYEEKAFIYKAMEVGAIKINSGGYVSDTGMPLGATLAAVVLYFKNPQNQELYLVTSEKIGRS